MLPVPRCTSLISALRLGAALLLALVPCVRADGPRPAAGSFPITTGAGPNRATTPGHAWAVLEVSDASVKAALLHLPPRATEGAAGAEMGTVRPGAYLTTAPERLAAWANEVWLVFPPETIRPGERMRRVSQTAAVRSAIGALWVSSPEGRLRPLPSLPGEGRLLGFVGSDDGPAALIEPPPEGSAAPAPVLYVLHEREWEAVELPASLRDTFLTHPTSVHLVQLADGVGVLNAPPEGEAELWVAAAADEKRRRGGEAGEPGETPAAVSAPRVEWTRRVLAASTPERRAAAPTPGGDVLAFGDQFVYAARGGDGATEVWAISPRGPVRIATLPEIGHPYALAPLYDTGRVAVLWSEVVPNPAGGGAEGQQADPATVRRMHRIAEVSVMTGRVMYNGPARADSPVSIQDFQLLAMLLVGVMLVIVLFVLRPDAEREAFSLPRGLALAEPGRRIIAGLIDAAPAMVLAVDLTGARPADLFTLNGLLGEGDGVWAVAAALAIGFAHCTLAEWLFGRSLGKALTGCEVVAISTARAGEDGQITPVAGRLTLGKAAVRNFVRWAVPPLALEGLSNPGRRHRGDLLAGTAVVIRVDEAAEGPARP